MLSCSSLLLRSTSHRIFAVRNVWQSKSQFRILKATLACYQQSCSKSTEGINVVGAECVNAPPLSSRDAVSSVGDDYNLGEIPERHRSNSELPPVQNPDKDSKTRYSGKGKTTSPNGTNYLTSEGTFTMHHPRDTKNNVTNSSAEWSQAPTGIATGGHTVEQQTTHLTMCQTVDGQKRIKNGGNGGKSAPSGQFSETRSVGAAKLHDPRTSDEIDEADDVETMKQKLEESQHGRPYSHYPKEFDPFGDKVSRPETLEAMNIALDGSVQIEAERRYREVVERQEREERDQQQQRQKKEKNQGQQSSPPPSQSPHHQQKRQMHAQSQHYEYQQQEQKHVESPPLQRSAQQTEQGSPIDSFPMTPDQRALHDERLRTMAAQVAQEKQEDETRGVQNRSCEETGTCGDSPAGEAKGKGNVIVEQYDEAGRPILTSGRSTAVEVAEPEDGSDVFTAMDRTRELAQSAGGNEK